MVSIRWKLILSYVILSALTAILVGFISFFLIKGFVNKQAEHELRLTAERIERQLRPYLSDFDANRIDEAANLLSAVNNIHIRILDDGRRVLSDTQTAVATIRRTREELLNIVVNARNGVARVTSDDLGDSQLLRVVIPELLSEGEKNFPETRDPGMLLEGRALTLPIRGNGGLLGFIELQHPPDLADEALAQSKWFLFMSGFTAVAVALIVGLLMGQRLTSPLISLNNAVRRIGNGDLSVRARVKRNDEIGELANSVNRMADTIESNIEALRSERDALKSFVEDASHELKTPVTALRTFNELLVGSSGEDPVARLEFLQDSKTQIDRLQWIVQALTGLTRIDGDVADIKLEPIRLSEIISEAMQCHRERTDERLISFEVAVDPEIHAMCNRQLIHTAIGNIIDNAVKYSPESGVIGIEVTENEKEHRISISDHGPGIHDDDLPHIFRRFYRSPKAPGEGSGLGLALSDSIVKAHHGRIDVETRTSLQSGTTFTISLPRPTSGHAS